MSLLVNISGMIKKCAQHLNSLKYFKKDCGITILLYHEVLALEEIYSSIRSVNCRKTKTLLIAMTQF